MGKIDYKKIYDRNRDDWKALTRDPQKYEALLAGHYSDSNHFIYELIQNAEDAGATKIVFEYDKEKLVFYHNGKPFDKADVKGVSSMLRTTKDKNSGQTIGRFGMGFKSVFKHTYQPEIYSDKEAFRIENYLLPVQLETKWNIKDEKKGLVYNLSSGSIYSPFIDELHLTKIVIPFAKINDEGHIIAINSTDVINKLENLDGEILLFLSYIKNLFWIDKHTEKHAMISIDETYNDLYMRSCRIEGSAYGSKEEISKYLKFTKLFNHPEMDYAEVSIAYKLNSRANNINEIPNTNIWVYFPTKDSTDLPFLIHGSFETAVSREKLMEPSVFNSDLYGNIEDLICESLFELKKRSLITQMFLRKIMFLAFKERRLPDLKEKVTELVMKNKLLPDKDGHYRAVDELSVAVPFGIADFANKDLFKNSFSSNYCFVALNDENTLNFTEYFTWLKDELNIEVFDLISWADLLCEKESLPISKIEKEYEDLKSFYEFLSDYRESLYVKKSMYYYTRRGPYNNIIRESLSLAWEKMRQAPIILNENNILIKAYNDNELNIYLNSSSQYRSVVSSSIVNDEILREFKFLLEDGFKIVEFNNFQYIKEKVVNKYINIDEEINFESLGNYDKEYIEDINQIIQLISETQDSQSIIELLNDAYIMKVRDEEDEILFSRPQYVYVDSSIEGVNLSVYYEGVTDTRYQLDKEFYLNNSVSIEKLKKFGMITSIVTDGSKSGRENYNRLWFALDEYCPEISIDCLDENLIYIEENSESEVAKSKSLEILSLLLSISNKLLGKVKHGKSNSFVEGEFSNLLHCVQEKEWLFDKNGKLASPISISKFDMDSTIYGKVIDNKEAYKILGFVEMEKDSREETFDMVDSLDKRDKNILFKQLARELGVKFGDRGNVVDEEVETEDESVFDINNLVFKDFPSKPIKNREYLFEHVWQEFFCADPIKYQKVLRQIRVSKNPQISRSYAIGMYTNQNNTKICQMCKEAIDFVEVTEIANYGIEMNQLNLCFCRNCASKYRSFRDHNKEIFNKEMKKAISSLDISNESIEYEIELNSETSIYFTQTHIAEIQEIYRLISEHGIPGLSDESVMQKDTHNTTSDLTITKNDTEIHGKDYNFEKIRKGSYVKIKRIGSGSTKKILIDQEKFPFHETFLEKQIGEEVDFLGKRYEIVTVV